MFTFEKCITFLSSGHRCITESEGYHMVCLAKHVLNTTLSALNRLRGDPMENIDNKALRYAGYKQYTFWVHNHLGLGVRKVIPSCSVWKIRDTYPSKDQKYIPFKEYLEDKERSRLKQIESKV